jgi:hypothetical protein
MQARSIGPASVTVASIGKDAATATAIKVNFMLVCLVAGSGTASRLLRRQSFSAGDHACFKRFFQA